MRTRNPYPIFLQRGTMEVSSSSFEVVSFPISERPEVSSESCIQPTVVAQ
jgi:hypothetical protein